MKVNPEAIRRLRQDIGLTQEQLAQDAGVSQGTIASLETGRRETDGPVLRRLSRALGLKGDYDQIVAHPLGMTIAEAFGYAPQHQHDRHGEIDQHLDVTPAERLLNEVIADLAATLGFAEALHKDCTEPNCDLCAQIATVKRRVRELS